MNCSLKENIACQWRAMYFWGAHTLYARRDIQRIVPVEMSDAFCMMYVISDRGDWSGVNVMNACIACKYYVED